MTAHHRSDNAFSRVHYLATATLHGDAKADEVRELEQLMIDSDEARKTYADFIEVYQSLQTWAAGDSSEQQLWHPVVDGVEDAVDDSNDQVATRSFSLSHTLKHPKFLSLSGAALVIGLLLTAMALVTPPFLRAVVDREAMKNSDFVAQVTRIFDSQWSEGDKGLGLGARLSAGRRLVLEQGIAEVTFRSGARVILQGQTTFVLASEMASRLEDGRITVYAPETAHGFSVETPLGRVVDLGTQFGVSVDRKNQTAQVHTFMGRVQLETPSPEGDRPLVRFLRAGDAVELSATRPPENLAIDETAFVRNLAPSSEKLPAPVHQWTFNDGTANDRVGGAHGQLDTGATISDGRLHLDGGPNAILRTAPIEADIHAKTLISWVSLHKLDQSGGSILTLESADGTKFDGIVYGERTPFQWMAGSTGFQRSPVDNFGEAETRSAPSMVMMAVVYRVDGSITIYRNGVIYAGYRMGPLPTYVGGSDRVIFGRRHSTADVWQMAASIDEAHIYSVPLSPAHIRHLYEVGPLP